MMRSSRLPRYLPGSRQGAIHPTQHWQAPAQEGKSAGVHNEVTMKKIGWVITTIRVETQAGKGIAMLSARPQSNRHAVRRDQDKGVSIQLWKITGQPILALICW